MDTGGRATQRAVAEGRANWVFAEFTDIYEMQTDFEEKVEAEFNNMINKAMGLKPL